MWRNSILAALTLALFFRLNPIPSVAPPWSSSPNTKDDKEPYIPYLTRYISFHMPQAGLWKERNEGHLELAKLAADDKLLFQEAERPKVRRMRYLGLVSVCCSIYTLVKRESKGLCTDLITICSLYLFLLFSRSLFGLYKQNFRPSFTKWYSSWITS